MPHNVVVANKWHSMSTSMALVSSMMPLFALAFSSLHAAAPKEDPPAHDTVDRLIEREHAAGRFDGVVIAGRDGKLLYQRAIGAADRESGRPHTIGETWRWASVSKQVAAVVTMIEVERKMLSLDDTLATRLPTFQAPEASRITIRQLLQHNSGLPNPDASATAPGATVPSFYTRSFDDARQPMAAALAYCAGPQVTVPGVRFSYNNCDTWVLQAVLERVSGMTYQALLTATVLEPTAMTSVGMVDGSSATLPTMPLGYIDKDHREAALNLATFGAGGALFGSAQDLWRFDQALMRQRLLDASSLSTLWHGEPKLGYVALGAWSFPARLDGCAGPVALVERRGEIGGIQVRNLIAPAERSALIVFSNLGTTDFGEIWQSRGLAFELASATFCDAPARPTASDN